MLLGSLNQVEVSLVDEAQLKPQTPGILRRRFFFFRIAFSCHAGIIPDMGDDAIRIEWCNRPASLMHLSLAEYIAERQNRETGAELTSQAEESSIKLGKVDGGRARHEPGRMNGLEKKYAAHLELRRATGEIRDWKFEPLKLKLAPATFWTPDFAVKMPDGTVQLHETKGHWEDDARVKTKWAVKDFGSLFHIVVALWDKGMKDWKFEEFTA